MTSDISSRLSVVASAIAADIRSAPRVARLNGFRGLQLDVFSSQLSLPELSISGQREFRRLFSAEGQQIVALRTELSPKGFAPGADVDFQLARLRRAVEAAANLQCPLLCLDLGPLPQPVAPIKEAPRVSKELAGLILVPESAPAPKPAAVSAPPDAELVSQVNAAMIELGMLADRVSVMIGCSSSLASFAALRSAIDSARCSWLGIDLDPVAMLVDEWETDEIFSSIGPLIRHVRARDAVAGADKRTQPVSLGRGDTQWPELLAALDGAGYAGFITVDSLLLPDRLNGAIASAEYLRGLG